MFELGLHNSNSRPIRPDDVIGKADESCQLSLAIKPNSNLGLTFIETITCICY